MKNADKTKPADVASLQRLVTFFNHCPDHIYFKDLESRFTLVNPGMARWLGLGDPAEAIGRTDADYFSEAHARDAREDERALIRGEADRIAKEERETWPDGRITWVSTTKLPLRDAAGRTIGTYGFSRDVTERRAAEEAFLATHTKLREMEAIINRSPAIVFRWDAAPGWPIRYVSDNIRQWGVVPDQLISGAARYAELILPEDRAAVETELERDVRSGANAYSLEYRVRRSDGRVRWVAEDGLIGRGQAARRPNFQGIVLDVTERHEAEARLAEYRAQLEQRVTERTAQLKAANLHLEEEIERRRAVEREALETAARYQAIVESYDGLIYICSEDYRVEFMNARMIERTGRNAVGEVCHQALHELDGVCSWCANERVLNGETVRWEVRSPKDGRWFYVVNSPIRHPDGRRSKIAMIQDITERKEAELALQESEQRYRRLLESVTDYVYTVEVRDGQPVATQHGAGGEAVTGYRSEDHAANPFLWFEMVLLEDRPAVLAHAKAVLAGGDAVPLDHRIVRKDGEVRWVRNTPSPRRDAQGRLVGYDGLVKDVSDRKRAVEERIRLERETAEARERAALERANRLASLGLLAAGIAHEVNNPLQGMLSHLAAVRRDLTPDFPRRDSLAMVERGIETISSLVQRLLWLGAARGATSQTARFSEAIAFVRELLRSTLEKSGGCGLRPRTSGRPTWSSAFSHEELVQLLLNLTMNARDAMPHGGELRIACDREGPRAVITVADTGVGIAPELRARIFTPFFTTKGARGTGLGLSITDSLVRAHGGEISFESEPGRGTTFRSGYPRRRQRHDVSRAGGG